MAFVNSNEGKDVVIVAGRVVQSGDQSITSGKGFSIADSGVGTTTVTFDRAFDTLIAVTASSLAAGDTMHVGTITHTDGTLGPSIIFQGNAVSDGTDGDTTFSFITVWEVDT